MLGTIKSAIERDDHFEIDDGTEAPFVVRKTELSQAQVDKVRRLYCGGKVQRFDAGGVVEPNPMTLGQGVPEGEAPGQPLPDADGEPVAAVGNNLAAGVVAADAGLPVDQPLGQGLPEGEAPGQRLPAVAGEPSIVPAGQGNAGVVAAGGPALAAAGEMPAPVASTVAPAQSGVPGLRPDQYGYADVEISPAASAPELPAATDVGTRLDPTALMAGRTGVEAADIAALTPEATARVRLEQSQEAARRRELEQSRRAYLEREADRVGAEREAAQLVDIARRNKQAETEARDEYKRRGEALKDTEKTRIEAFRLFGQMEGWQRVVAAISVIGGAAMSARSKRPNLALKIIEGAIDTDIESQKQEMATARANRLTEYQAAGATLGQATDLVRADMLTVASARARASAARSTSRAARDAFEGLATTLDVRRDEAVLRAIHDMGAAAVAQATQRRALATEVRLAEIRDSSEQRAARADVRAAEEHTQAMRLRELADRRAERQLGLQAAAQAVAARESRARIGHMAAAEKRAQLADKNTAIDMLAIMAQSGKKLSPEQRAVLKPAERALMVPTADGNYRAANTAESAKRWTDVREAAAEVNTALSRLEPYFRVDAAGNARSAPSAEFFGGANKSAIDSHHTALLLALGKLAKAGDLSENQRKLFEGLAPYPQAWGTGDKGERGSFEALSARVLGLQDELEKELLVPLKP